MRTAVAILLFTVAVTPAMGQTHSPATLKWADSANKLIAAGNNGQPAALDNAIALIDRVLTVTPNDAVMLHYKGYALYRKTNPLMADESKKAEVKAILDEADAVLERSAKTLAWAESHALRASIAGQMIAVGNPMSGMWLGPRADGYMDKATELGPNNPRVWMLKGIGTLFKPKMFGGGADKAEKELMKAVELFANDRPTAPAPAWGHAEVYAWLGQAYARQDKDSEARKAYQKALELDPNFGWVTYVLIPELEKKAAKP